MRSASVQLDAVAAQWDTSTVIGTPYKALHVNQATTNASRPKRTATSVNSAPGRIGNAHSHQLLLSMNVQLATPRSSDVTTSASQLHGSTRRSTTTIRIESKEYCTAPTTHSIHAATSGP